MYTDRQKEGAVQMTDIHVLFLNASLKDSSEPSHTQGLYEKARKLYEQEGVQLKAYA